MRVIQLNTKKAFVAAIELAKKMADKSNYLCLITEPYKYKNKIGSVPTGARSISYESKNTRAAIIFSSDIDILKVESLCGEDCAVGLTR